MDDAVDLLVVGGGLTGASLAASLADWRRLISVLEARAARITRFTGELIHPTGVDVPDANGLLGPLESEGGVRVEGFAVMPGPSREEPSPDPMMLRYAEIPGRRPWGFATEHHEMVARL